MPGSLESTHYADATALFAHGLFRAMPRVCLPPYRVIAQSRTNVHAFALACLVRKHPPA